MNRLDLSLLLTTIGLSLSAVATTPAAAQQSPAPPNSPGVIYLQQRIAEAEVNIAKLLDENARLQQTIMAERKNYEDKKKEAAPK